MDGYGTQRVDTVVIGGGQAGLAIGYHLRKQGRPFVILDADARDRRLVAEALGLAPALHACAIRVAAGRPFPGAGLALPDQGRDGRLPRVLRGAVLAAGPERRVRGPAVARGRPVHGVGGRAAVRGRQRRRGDGRQPPAAYPGVRRPARSRDRAAPFGRVPEPVAAPRREASSSSAPGNSGADISIEVAREHPTWMSGPRSRARSVPHRDVGGAQRRWSASSGSSASRADAPHADGPEGSAGGSSREARRSSG